MSNRLQLIIEFNKGDIKEVKAFLNLKNVTYPGSLIKDALLGRIPFEAIKSIIEKENSENIVEKQ